MKVLSSKKILILGASGQLGSEFQNELSAHPSQVTFVRRSSWRKEYKSKSNHKYISEDLLKIKDAKLEKLIFEADIIFHLAADTSVQEKPENERNFLISQLNLLNRILVLLVGSSKKLLFSSSCSVYGLKHSKIINDLSISDPHTSYDLLKTYSDQLIEYYQKIYQVNCCAIRFSNIYGRDSSLNKSKNRRVLNKFLDQMHLNQRVAVVENGKFYRNFLHVTDAVRMLVYLARQNRFDQSIYIGCSKKNILFIDAVKLLSKYFEINFNCPVKISRNFPSSFITDTRSFKLRPSKIFANDFKFKFNLEKGFLDLIKGDT